MANDDTTRVADEPGADYFQPLKQHSMGEQRIMSPLKVEAAPACPACGHVGTDLHACNPAPADATSGETAEDANAGGEVYFGPYRGYRGKAANGHGELLDMKDVVTFAGNTVSELASAFSASVDDYLAFCESRREAPAPPAEEGELDVWKYRVFSMDIRLDSGGRRVAKFSKPDDADKFHEWLKGLRGQAIDAQNWQARIRELEQEVERLKAQAEQSVAAIAKKLRAILDDLEPKGSPLSIIHAELLELADELEKTATPAQPAKPETGKGDCPACGGTGGKLLSPCKACEGTGDTEEESPAPSPHVETGGQEPDWKAAWDAVEKHEIVVYPEGDEDSPVKWRAKYRRRFGHSAPSQAFDLPHQAALALASQLSASQADQQHGKERA